MTEILFDRYKVLRKLGSGAQSEVFLVRDLRNQNLLKAAKIIKTDKKQALNPSDLSNEFHILESLQHESLVRVLDWRVRAEDGSPVVISEFIQGCANCEEVWKNDLYNWTERKKLRFAFQLIDAVRYLHAKKIIHGDLKPSNILLVNEFEEEVSLKLIDFGVSQDLFFDKKKSARGPLII